MGSIQTEGSGTKHIRARLTPQRAPSSDFPFLDTSTEPSLCKLGGSWTKHVRTSLTESQAVFFTSLSATFLRAWGPPHTPGGPRAPRPSAHYSLCELLASLGLSLAFMQEHRIKGKQHHSNAVPAGTLVYEY